MYECHELGNVESLSRKFPRGFWSPVSRHQALDAKLTFPIEYLVPEYTHPLEGLRWDS